MQRSVALAQTPPECSAEQFNSKNLSEFAAGLGSFSLAEARTIVGEFFQPIAWIYWLDFLLCYIAGFASFRYVRMDYVAWPLRLTCFAISCVLFYRCALFIHELVHIRAEKLRAFRITWNLLCGIPFLLPTFVYFTHLDHHRRKHYGTEQDGEYLPLASSSPWQILFYLSQSFIIPLLAVVRFGLLTPLSWFLPPVRRWAHRHASSLVMDPSYIRPLPTKTTLRIIRLQELGCFLYLVGFGAVLATGILPWFVAGQAYCTGVVIIMVNALRTLGAHRWLNSDGREMTFVEQMVDSVNYSHNPVIGSLWAPVGLRFHALHHIFPTIPYHALGKAHARLMKELPADSPYRLTEGESLTAALRVLWRRAKESQQPSQQRATAA